MNIVINSVPGTLYFSNDHPDLRAQRPTVAFVPSPLLIEGELDQEAYTDLGWASANCQANRYATGSHVWPDLKAPLTEGTLQPGLLDDFIQKITRRTARLKLSREA